MAAGKRWRIGDMELFTADYPMPVREFVRYDLVSAGAAQTALQRWVSHPEHRVMLLDVCRSAATTQQGQTPNDRDIEGAIQDAFRAGRLYLLRHRTGGIANQGAEQKAKDAAKASAGPLPAASEKTWIEIHLIDQKDRPVANRAYRLKITDGSVRTGQLGSDGVIRVTGIDPGTCEITFLDLDGDEWRPA